MTAAPVFAQNFASAQKKVRDSVVLVYCQDEKGNISTGTGFFISEDGLLLTCAHVVKDTLKIRIRSETTGNDAEASVVSMLWDTRSNKGDIALLKVMGTGNFPPVKLGDTTDFSAKENTGMEVGVLGYPRALDLAQFGKDFTMSGTKGSITAIQGSNLEAIIQHDAAVNPGNSGGPIFDMNGAVIGIVNAKLREAEGINFAINIQAAKKLIADLEPTAGIDIKNTEQFSSFLKKVARTVNTTTLSIATRPREAGCGIRETTYVNKSPFKIHLYPGDYTIMVMKDGYKTEERIVTVEANKANEFVLDLVSVNQPVQSAPVKKPEVKPIDKTEYTKLLPKETGTLDISSAKKAKVYYLHLRAFYEFLKTNKLSSDSYYATVENIEQWITRKGNRKNWELVYELCSSSFDTPCSITLPIGDYAVWTEDKNLFIYKEATVRQNETQTLYFDNGPRTVRVYTKEEGVSIYNDAGNLVGKTKRHKSGERPFMEFEVYLQRSSYKITAKKEGFYSNSTSISTMENEPHEVSFELKKDRSLKTFSRTDQRSIFSLGVMINPDKAFKDVYKTVLGGGFNFLSGSGDSLFSWRWFYGINAYAGSTAISKAAPPYMDSGTVVFANSGLGGGVNMAINRFALYLGLAHDMALLYEKVDLKGKGSASNFAASIFGVEADVFAEIMITHTVGLTLLYKYHYNPTLLQSILADHEEANNIGGHAMGIGIRF